MMRFDRFTERAQEVAQSAAEIIQRYGHNQIDTEHILLGLVEQQGGVILQILERLNVNPEHLVERLDSTLRASPKANIFGGGAGQIWITPRIKRVIDLANEEANRLNDEWISTEHMFLSILTEKNTPAARILESAGLTRDRVYDAVQDLRRRGGGEHGMGEAESKLSISERHYNTSNLPDDLLYLQFLARKFTEHSGNRKKRIVESLTDDPVFALLPENVRSLKNEIDQLRNDEEEAGLARDYELAAQKKVERLRNEETYKTQREIAEKAIDITKIDLEKDVNIFLSEFDLLLLKLFLIEEEINQQRINSAYNMILDTKMLLDNMFTNALQQKTSDILERLSLIGDIVSKDVVNQIRKQLDTLKTGLENNLSIDERVNILENINQQISRFIIPQSRIVCKVNVFTHGHRDLIEMDSNATLKELSELLKEKYRDEILSYLFKTHRKRLLLSDVKITYLFDSATANPDQQISEGTLLTDIPDKDTDGITWYPDWIKKRVEQLELRSGENIPLEELELNSSTLKTLKKSGFRDVEKLLEWYEIGEQMFDEEIRREIEKRLREKGFLVS